MTMQQLVKTIETLPPEGVNELENYLEYLRFKYQQKSKRRRKPLKLKELKGILKGYDFSPEKIAQARREMWGNFGRERLLDG